VANIDNRKARHATGAKGDGDRREPIVKDDDDRRTFVGTLGEACERAGFRIHAWVLMIARTVAS
jgi:hypothetical protein